MTARRCRPETSCRSSSNRSAITSDELRDNPVTLPPGCISVLTRPRETGSSTPTKTIGIVASARVAASVAGVPAVTRIVAPEPISSLTMAGKRLGALFGPAVDDTNVSAVGPAERRELTFRAAQRLGRDIGNLHQDHVPLLRQDLSSSDQLGLHDADKAADQSQDHKMRAVRHVY
jgi:hypothetical protein